MSFNSATARWPWITYFHFLFGERLTPASIRPRPAGRGSPDAKGQGSGKDDCFNSATARWPWITSPPPAAFVRQAGAASIRPRPAGRGSHYAWLAATATGFRLQFGHGPLAVDHQAGRVEAG